MPRTTSTGGTGGGDTSRRPTSTRSTSTRSTSKRGTRDDAQPTPAQDDATRPVPTGHDISGGDTTTTYDTATRHTASPRPSRALALEMLLARWADRVAWLIQKPLRAARTPAGKRALTVAAAILALAGTVRVLYASAEPPVALPDAPVAAASPTADEPQPEPEAEAQPNPAPEDEADAEAGANGEEEPPEQSAGGGPPYKPVKPTAEEAAVAFYALELDLPETSVRALMQTRVNDNSVNVLVLAERGEEDLPTRLIQVNRTQSGWRVP